MDWSCDPCPERRLIIENGRVGQNGGAEDKMKTQTDAAGLDDDDGWIQRT